MAQVSSVRRLFPGSNTPRGFHSYYDFIVPPARAARLLILKGGPGVGKSTLMKRLGKEMEARGFDVEYHHCSADPGSLDAVAIPSLGAAMLDGTHPHVIDPKYPGAVDEIVHLGEYWDDRGLRPHRQEIARLTAESSWAYQRAYRYLGASRLVYDEIEAINARGADFGRLNQIAEELIETNLPQKTAAPSPGSLRSLFASAITPRGNVHHLESLIGPARRRVVLQGPPGSGRSTILEKLVRAASERGYVVERFHCPFDPLKVEHVVLPELDLAVTTSAPPHVWRGDADQFFDTQVALSSHIRQQNRRELKEAEDEYLHLFHMAVASLKEARSRHDELERLYTPHMDFARLEKVFERALQELLALPGVPAQPTLGGV